MNLTLLCQLTYQGAKKIIDKMEEGDLINLDKEIKVGLQCNYNVIQDYGNIEYGCCGKKNDRHVYIKDIGVSQKDYGVIMSRIKKLEIIYGYVYDKLNNTSFFN